MNRRADRVQLVPYGKAYIILSTNPRTTTLRAQLSGERVSFFVVIPDRALSPDEFWGLHTSFLHLVYFMLFDTDGRVFAEDVLPL